MNDVDQKAREANASMELRAVGAIWTPDGWREPYWRITTAQAADLIDVFVLRNARLAAALKLAEDSPVVDPVGDWEADTAIPVELSPVEWDGDLPA